MKTLIILISLLFISCGSRTVNKTHEKVDHVVNLTKKDSIVTKNNVLITFIDTSAVNYICYEPINDTLPMIIMGKSFKNVKIVSNKNARGMSMSKIDKSTKIETNSTRLVDTLNVDTQTKETIRESSNYWVLIIILAGIILTWFELKKN